MNRLMNISRVVATRMALRNNSSLRSAMAARLPFNIPAVQQKYGFHSHSAVMYASHQDSNQWQQQPQTGTGHPLMDQLAQHPHIMQQLLDFTAFIQTKGIDPTGKQLNYMQVMKVMQDPEVRSKVQKLAEDMKKAGIQLDMATIAELQKSLNQTPTTDYQQQNQAETDEKNDDKQQGGVMNKVKGFFKK